MGKNENKIPNSDMSKEKITEYKMISFYAKRARGLMTRFVLDNNIQDPEDLRAFDKDGYLYNAGMSRPGKPVFTRDK